MKKLFLLFALLGMVAVSCSMEQPNEEEGGNENDIPENIFFALDKESITISPDGGSVDIVVYSNYKWEISGTSDWCTPSITNGEANEDGQKVTFSADMTYDDREATFWFRCADEKTKLVVSQKLKAVIIPDENNSFNIPAEGGIAVISYQTSVDCEIIIPQEAQDWITIAPATRGLVSESVTLNIAENTTYDPRSAVIKVVAKNNAELVVEYTINQEQNNALLVDENNTFTVPSMGGEVVINYQTNVNCEVIIPEEALDWITIAPATRGLVTYNTTLNITANDSGKQRSSVVKVISQDHNELFAEYTITQDTRCFLYYTSNNGIIVEPNNSSSFDAAILSNTYNDGVGAIVFNAPITTIGDGAFRDCTTLTSVTIPDSVTLIGHGAFSCCLSLTSVTIPDSVTTIGDYAFSSCDSLTSVTMGNSVTTIGGFAFSSCDSLTSVTMGNSVTTIGGFAFYRCTSLTSVTIPDSVTTIGDSAFSWCDSLTSVTIPDSVTTIGKYAFCACNSLTSVTIPDSVTTIGDYAFSECSSLTSVTMGNSVTTIGGFAFYRCTSLTSVTIPDSVTEIGSYAFSYCRSLTSVTMGNSVTTIGGFAFYDCSSLTSVTIPDSVTLIENGAFYDCSSLTSVYCKAVTPPMGGSDMFDNTASGCKIYVPRNSVEAYEDSYYWGDYYIVGYDF